MEARSGLVAAAAAATCCGGGAGAATSATGDGGVGSNIGVTVSSVKEALGNKISNHVDMIGLMCRGLMVEVGGNGEGAQVVLSLALAQVLSVGGNLFQARRSCCRMGCLAKMT